MAPEFAIPARPLMITTDHPSVMAPQLRDYSATHVVPITRRGLPRGSMALRNRPHGPLRGDRVQDPFDYHA